MTMAWKPFTLEWKSHGSCQERMRKIMSTNQKTDQSQQTLAQWTN